MTVEIGPGPVAPPGGVQPTDRVILVRPGSPASLYGVPGTNLLSASGLAAVLASLPTTPQPDGVAWLNGGFLCFSTTAAPARVTLSSTTISLASSTQILASAE